MKFPRRPAVRMRSNAFTENAGLEHFDPGNHEIEKLPKAAREYLAFMEKETGARIGMVSTGPGREETIFVDEFRRETSGS